MKKALALALSAHLLAVYCFAQGNQFKVRYNGGTVTTKVKGDDWGNLITVTPSEILLKLKDGQEIRIDPKRVNGLSYGRTPQGILKVTEPLRS